MADRLYRSQEDKMIAGVAGGLARQFDADPSIIRIIWAIAIIASGGLGLLLYIVMAIVVPYPPEGDVTPGAAGATTDPAAGGGSTVAATTPARRGDGGRSAARVIGVILVVLGGLFLARELLPEIDFSASWPVLSVILGVVLIVLSVRPGRSAS